MRDIKTIAGLRAWLESHVVFALDAGSEDVRVLSGHDGKRSETVSVSTVLFRTMDADLVWRHDSDGGDLPSHCLFALRPPAAAEISVV
jgi:hypothetical protein